MRIEVIVTPKAKQNSVERISISQYKVRTTSPALQGKANESVIELIADYFKVKKSAVEILSGETFRRKVIDISL